MKLIDNTNCYIKPTENLLGLRPEDQYVNGKMNRIYKTETFQYVSIIKTLNLLLKNKQIINVLNSFKINLASEPLLFAGSTFWGNKKTLRLIYIMTKLK